MPIPQLNTDDYAWLTGLLKELGLNPDLTWPWWNNPDGSCDRVKTEAELRRMFGEGR